MAMPFIDLFAWIVLLVVVATLVATFVALGVMPGRIARRRGHPWAQAVTVGSWATLVFGFMFWLSIGVQKGPRIGVQKGPTSRRAERRHRGRCRAAGRVSGAASVSSPA
jgi:hypothetical protein